MISYIDLVNRFWEVDELHSFSGNETRLYFYLLKVANKERWPTEFERGDKKTEGDTGFSKGTLKSCRNRLVEVGLIDFSEGGKGQGNKVRYQIRYQILTPKAVVRCQSRCQNLAPTLTPNDAPTTALVSDKVSNFDTYSIYKRLKTVYTLTNGRVRKEIIRFRRLKKREKKAPLIPRLPPPTEPARPMPKWGDPFTLKSDSEKLNVPYSQWKALYPIDGNETQLRKLWLGLEEGERQKALTHTPDYVKSAPERFLKAPANYLEQKQFNDRIIDRNGKQAPNTPQTGRIEPLPGQSFGAWSGHRFGRPPEPDERQAS